MRKILVLGAGRSASCLIRYLLDHSKQENWEVVIADVSEEMARSKTRGHPRGIPVAMDIKDEAIRGKMIAAADIVVSLLPPALHSLAALDCIHYRKHLVTASYVSAEIRKLDEEARKTGTLLLNEMGLDPGIDHMSAMKLIDHIRETGGELVSFKSYCGGLIAPESNDNPWGYKFTWNPRNVVLAGQGVAQYKENGKHKFIPYNRLFTQTEKIKITGHGTFEAYANRDSLSYRQPYGLEHIPTILRGTLRYPGFCEAWQALISLGLTDDTCTIQDAGKLTWKELTRSFLPPAGGDAVKNLCSFLKKPRTSHVIQNIKWLGLLGNHKIKLTGGTPAQLLQSLLEEKWMLKKKDKDMVVMQHQFVFRKKGKTGKLFSSLVVKGEDQVYTAMAKTVGLPMAMSVKLILNGRIRSAGVQIPVTKEFYEPILAELETQEIKFREEAR